MGFPHRKGTEGVDSQVGQDGEPIQTGPSLSSCILALPCWTEAYTLVPSDLVFPALIIVVVVVSL